VVIGYALRLLELNQEMVQRITKPPQTETVRPVQCNTSAIIFSQSGSPNSLRRVSSGNGNLRTPRLEKITRLISSQVVCPARSRGGELSPSRLRRITESRKP
jgi:hypothetical protein